MRHVCEIIYEAGASGKLYGDISGVCRVTGSESKGLDFNKWIKKTFNDFDYLKNGNIISNEALFCFDEASEIIKKKTEKDNLQRFRTYSHVVANGEWFCLTKANKEQIFNLIINGAEIVCLTESGQKHILFKHKLGMWQLDDLYVVPDIELLKMLHSNMCELLSLGFSQTEIISGNYKSSRIIKSGLLNWKKIEDNIKIHRGVGMFDFASFMLFSNKKELNENTTKNTEKLEIKPNNMVNGQLSMF